MSLGGLDLPSPPPSPSHDPLQDVFNDHADSGAKDSSFHPSSTVKVQRVHFDNGYRDGISSAKGTHVQDGFDEGYPLGAELALRVGVILGAFEELSYTVKSYMEKLKAGVESKSTVGPLPAVQLDEEAAQSTASGPVGLEQWAMDCEKLQLSRKACHEELTLQSIFSRHYFNEEGIWMWDTESSYATMEATCCPGEQGAAVKRNGDENPHSEDNSDVTFREVADSHPLIVKWRADIAMWMKKNGLESTELAWSQSSIYSNDEKH